MVATTLIVTLALLVGAVVSTPTRTIKITGTATSSATSAELSEAKLRHGLARLRKPRLNKRNKVGGWNGAAVDNQFVVEYAFGTFTVPTPRIPPGGPKASNQNYGVAIWLGIDNDAPLWQAGILMSLNHQDEPVASAWYCWCSSQCELHKIDFSVSPGDKISIGIGGFGYNGTAEMWNNRTGKAVKIIVDNQEGFLLPNSAAWIVEDPGISPPAGSPSPWSAPFPAFDPIYFSGCYYDDVRSSGNNLTQAEHLSLAEQPDGRPVVEVHSTGDNAFSVTYNGTSFS